MSLPASAITVLGILATRGPLTHQDLVTVAPIPARTVRFALKRLHEEGRIVERQSLRDARRSYYALATGDRATELGGGWDHAPAEVHLQHARA